MKKQSRPTNGAGKVVKGAAYGLFLLFALLVGTTAGWINQSRTLVEMLKQAWNPKAPQETFSSSTITLLVLGCDEDVQDVTEKILKKQARSDMMLIAKLDFSHNLVTGISIPRDTRCKLPGYKMQKINAYHNIAKKGQEAELTQRAVEFLLPGVRIDRVVTLDFDHFQDLVNLVGGVPIDIEKNLDYNDNAGNLHIHLKKGPQVLNGLHAMEFVRFRHGDSDFVRQERQKQFLVAFKQQSLKEWRKVPQIVEEGQKVLGGALSDAEIASIALWARKLPPQNIQWGQVPVKEIKGSSDLLLDEDKVHDELVKYRLIETHDDGTIPSGGNQ